MQNVYDVLEARGFTRQCSHPEELKALLAAEKVTFYIGFDPTADSLHIGHYVALMTMAHMQRAGHRPIVLLGGGTAAIGDPSGKTDMRRMMTVEELDHNAAQFQKQMARLIDFSGGKAILENNARWLRSLNFLDFMRDIGVHFSVNRMLTAECYKQRMEKGLTFFEMSYMLMQSYDFLMLNREYNCVLQMGGDDQWSNILGGADLIRRKEQRPAFALTTALLTTSEGKKMGKTEKGALWLDKEKTPVYDFYQYWRNVDDADVKTCLCLLTFLPLEEISALCAEGGAALNNAKRVLAFTLTEQVHGTEEAKKAQTAAEALFGGGGDLENMPSVALNESQITETGLRITDLLVLGKLCASKSDARRMIESGAVFADEEKVTDVYFALDANSLTQGVILRKGKKGFVRILRA
ncbi:MAG TPA: tyrosine--tRNA ligase [Clostridia bacterium]|nr:tyrosine--tRNA ligase [Clostridia bacterium]